MLGSASSLILCWYILKCFLIFNLDIISNAYKIYNNSTKNSPYTLYPNSSVVTFYPICIIFIFSHVHTDTFPPKLFESKLWTSYSCTCIPKYWSMSLSGTSVIWANHSIAVSSRNHTVTFTTTLPQLMCKFHLLFQLCPLYSCFSPVWDHQLCLVVMPLWSSLI